MPGASCPLGDVGKFVVVGMQEEHGERWRLETKTAVSAAKAGRMVVVRLAR
jgi:hypothetical protein